MTAPDVRARLMALADEQKGGKADEQCFERLALAAYRMAIQDAERACEAVSECDVDDPAQAFIAAVRALAEGL